MRANEIMTVKVDTVTPDTTAAAALGLMRTKRYHHLVVARKGTVLGLVSDRDLRGCETLRGSTPVLVEHVMTTSLVTVAPETPVRKIANVLRGRAIGCVPVMDGRKLLGIVTVTDLLDLIGRGLERGSVDVKRPTLSDRGPRKGTKAHTKSKVKNA